MSHAFAWRRAALASLVLIPALGLGISPAMAQSADADTEVHSMVLHYGDLDLSTAKGRGQLNTRIREAAASVCGMQPGVRTQPQIEEFRDCYNQALNHAQRTLAQKQQDMQLVRR